MVSNNARNQREGRAYGFVDCNGSTGQLRHFIDTSHKKLGAENLASMRIDITEGVNPDKYRNDEELYKIAVQARECGRITHTIEAISDEGDNYQVGSKLGEIINKSAMIYSHAHGHNKGDGLYGQNGQTWSRIVYKQGDEYWDVE